MTLFVTSSFPARVPFTVGLNVPVMEARAFGAKRLRRAGIGLCEIARISARYAKRRDTQRRPAGAGHRDSLRHATGSGHRAEGQTTRTELRARVDKCLGDFPSHRLGTCSQARAERTFNW